MTGRKVASVVASRCARSFLIREVLIEQSSVYQKIGAHIKVRQSNYGNHQMTGGVYFWLIQNQLERES